MVLAQVAVDEKSNEHYRDPRGIKTLGLWQDALVTIDAMGTQRAIAAQIIEQQADYALALKENQGNLYENVKDSFALAQKDHFRRHRVPILCAPLTKIMVGSKSGNIGSLTIVACLTYLDETGKWKGLQAIGRVRVRTTDWPGGDDRVTLLSAQFCQGCQTLCDIDSQSLGHRKQCALAAGHRFSGR